MICCRECLDLLCDYLEGNLDDKVKRSLEEHFQDCPPCISFLNTYTSTSRICKDTLRQIEIPEIVQIKLREFIQSHIKKA